MKNLLSMMLMLLMFLSCSDDKDEQKEIILDKGVSTEQTIYSDETSTKDGISFTASENWVAAVNDISTRAAGRVDWLELSQYSGGPGKFTLGITIAKNDTGSDRKAEIKIVSGGTTITVVVEQKAVTSEEAGKEPGVDPEKPQARKKVKTVKVYSELYSKSSADMPHVIDDMYLELQYDLFYDEQGRIVKYYMSEYWPEPLPNSDIEWKKEVEKYSLAYKKQDNGNLMIEVKDLENYLNIEYLYCDNTGKVVSAKTSEDKGDENPYIKKYQYVYDELNQLIQTERKKVEPYAADPYTTDFTWSGHNLVAYKSSASLFGSGNITYSDLKNDANIDLAYIACFGVSTEMLAFPHGIERGTITGCFGKRVANMPATIKGSSNDAEESYAFEYKRDADDYIVEVKVTGSSENQVIIEYMD